jgi:hypothetical protein
MPSASEHPGLRRVAGLRLRGVRVRVAWPEPAGGLPALLVFAGEDLERADELCARAGVVVLWPGNRPGAAAATLEWAADHAVELDADGGRLAVAGGTLAAALALRARAQGWPALARQILIHPAVEPPPDLRGVAPATVVTAGPRDRRYVAALRRAGVEVEALHDADPGRALADAARSLRRALAAGGRR